MIYIVSMELIYKSIHYPINVKLIQLAIIHQSGYETDLTTQIKKPTRMGLADTQ